MGWILQQLYTLCGRISPSLQNYALVIFLFTVLINVVFVPLNIRQQKTTAQQAALRPKLEMLKKKYGDDRQKYSMEMQNLYQRENVKMMGGCLPMLIRLPVLWGVYRAISYPLSYIIRFNEAATGEKLEAAKQFLINNILAFKGKKVAGITELNLINNIESIKDSFPQLYEQTQNALNFNFFGLNLTNSPKFTMNFSQLSGQELALWIIPFLSLITALISSWINLQTQKKTNPDAAQMGTMMMMMPIMSLVIAFTVPAAVGLYWVFSNITMTAIQLFVNKFYNPYSIIAQNEAKMAGEIKSKEEKRMQSAANN